MLTLRNVALSLELIKQSFVNLKPNAKDIKFAYLFGSWATNTANALSDVDLAIYIEPAVNTFDKQLEIHHQLSKQLKTEIDLVVLNTAKNYNLLNAIFREGIVLVDNDKEFRLMFEVKKEHQILGFKAFRKYIDGIEIRKENSKN